MYKQSNVNGLTLAKDLEYLRRTMESAANGLVPYSVTVEHKVMDGTYAASYKDKNGGHIWINFNEPLEVNVRHEDEFKGRQFVLIEGHFAHEILHLMLTDFSYANAVTSAADITLQSGIHEISNVLEDPSIEYQSNGVSLGFPSFLRRCLRQRIRYSYANTPELGSPELGELDPYTEVIVAAIMLGDLGKVKGTFRSREAQEATRTVARYMLKSIQETDAKKRIDLHKACFDEIRSLYDEHIKNQPSMDLLEQVLQKFGKGSSKEALDAGKEFRPGRKGVKIMAPLDPGKIQIDLNAKKMDGISGNSDSKKDSHLQVGQSASEAKRKKTSGGSDEAEEAPGADAASSAEGSSEKDNAKNFSGEKRSSGENQHQDTGTDDHEQEDKQAAETESLNLSDQISDTADKEEKADIFDTEQDAEEDLEDIAKTLKGLISVQKEKELKKIAAEAARNDIHGIDVAVPDAVVKVLTHARNLYDIPNTWNRNKQTLSALRSQEDIKKSTILLKAGFKKDLRTRFDEKEKKSSGSLNMKKVLGADVTTRLFYRRTEPSDKSDLAILFMVDESGSMRHDKRKGVMQTLTIILDALAAHPSVKTKVVGFGESNPVRYNHYNDENWKNDEKLRQRIMGLDASGGTYLAHAIAYGDALLKKRKERHKLFVIITDGDASSNALPRGKCVQVCRKCVRNAKKHSGVIGIGLFHDDYEANEFVSVFGQDAITLTDHKSLATKLPGKIRQYLSRTE